MSISRELTKIHQENIRGILGDVSQKLNEKNIKGEIVIIIEGA